MEINKKMICHMLELNYIKKQGYDYPVPEGIELFPFGWYSMDYNIRIDILTEALQSESKIIDTEKYSNSIEGLKNNISTTK